MIPASMRGPVLAISPHLDDAVMGVGATLCALAESGQRVVICTVFAGEPEGSQLSTVARAFHADCRLGPDAVLRRREEDQRAAAAIGAEVMHLPFPDAIYRQHDSHWLCERPRSMFDDDLPGEPFLVERISAALAGIAHDLGTPAIWTCAAIGGHVDHRITRRAVAATAREQGWIPLVWEGIPYAFGLPPPEARPVTITAVTPGHLARKLTAIAEYGSQIRMLFPGGEDWRRAFLSHAEARRAIGYPEVLWLMPLDR